MIPRCALARPCRRVGLGRRTGADRKRWSSTASMATRSAAPPRCACALQASTHASCAAESTAGGPGRPLAPSRRVEAMAATNTPRVALLYPGDRAARDRADPAESRFAALFDAFAAAGVRCRAGDLPRRLRRRGGGAVAQRAGRAGVVQPDRGRAPARPARRAAARGGGRGRVRQRASRHDPAPGHQGRAVSRPATCRSAATCTASTASRSSRPSCRAAALWRARAQAVSRPQRHRRVACRSIRTMDGAATGCSMRSAAATRERMDLRSAAAAHGAVLRARGRRPHDRPGLAAAPGRGHGARLPGRGPRDRLRPPGRQRAGSGARASRRRSRARACTTVRTCPSSRC